MFAAVSLGRVVGYHELAVMSGSMEPWLHPGDVVVGRPTSPARARPGDVISFRDPNDSGRVLTHRVVRVRLDGTNFRFVTKGDANTGTERWQIPLGGKIGTVNFRVPKLGYVLVWIRGPFGRLAFIGLPVLLLGGIALARIWRSSPPAATLPSRV